MGKKTSSFGAKSRQDNIDFAKGRYLPATFDPAAR
jgi:hypothetical protein